MCGPLSWKCRPRARSLAQWYRREWGGRGAEGGGGGTERGNSVDVLSRRDRQTDRQTDRQRQRDRDRETDTDRDRDTERHRETCLCSTRYPHRRTADGIQDGKLVCVDASGFLSSLADWQKFFPRGSPY